MATSSVDQMVGTAACPWMVSFPSSGMGAILAGTFVEFSQAVASAVQVLIAEGAQLDLRNNAKQTPLTFAVQYGGEDVAQILLTAGAK
jgi:ankyrin repeat protein